MKSVVILISGAGSNMRALAEAHLPCRIAAVISNRPDAAGLQVARELGIETRVIDHKQFAERELFDAALASAIDDYQPDVILLAGFMRVLGDKFINRFNNLLINIHPSLLPVFTGLHTHQRALDAGVKIHGCTVHFVTAQLDHGPIIIQAAVPVLEDDDATTLAARVQAAEHRIYPQAVQWLLHGAVSLREGRCVISHTNSAESAALISPKECL